MPIPTALSLPPSEPSRTGSLVDPGGKMDQDPVWQCCSSSQCFCHGVDEDGYFWLLSSYVRFVVVL